MRHMIFATALAAALTPALPASAAFFFEGLMPYATQYCDGQRADLGEPQVTPPAQKWDEASPDASSLGGRAAWTATGCGGKVTTRAPRVIAPVKRAPRQAPYVVPQK